MTGELAERLRQGDRRALGQAITLAESTRPEQREQAEALLAELAPWLGGSHRVALTGPPGAGKSTLLDALGAEALAQGKRVAVLAVDPASVETGGSLLGDAVRMQRLAGSERVFLRGSSNAGLLGGTAPATREAVLLCEAAGFDLVLVETVGVGQAELAARDLCDSLLLLTLAGTGDEVQGLKRGLLEVADAVLVNKADGAAQESALAHASELAAALALLRPRSAPHVVALSAQSRLGVAELWRWLNEREASLRSSGALLQRRKQQRERAFRAAVSRETLLRLEREPRVRELLPALQAAVSEEQLSPDAAARRLVTALFDSSVRS